MLILFFATVSAFSTVHASEYFIALQNEAVLADAERVLQICEGRAETTKTSFSETIDAFVKKYSTFETRVANRDSYKNDLNEIFRLSSWSHIYDCAQNFADHEKQGFTLEFIEPENENQFMRVDLEDIVVNGVSSTRLSLKLSLLTDPVMTMTTYTHEMLHVCQYERKKALDETTSNIWANVSDDEQQFITSQFNLGKTDITDVEAELSQSAIDFYAANESVSRSDILDELDGTYIMLLFYFEVVQNSSAYCGTDQNPTYYKTMLALQETFANKSFHLYLAHVYQPAYNIKRNSLFDIESEFTDYPKVPFLMPDGFSEQNFNYLMENDLRQRGY